MEVLDNLEGAERILSMRAAQMRLPFAGTFELLPVCNMDCRMCYIRSDFQTVQERGGLLTADQWIRIAEAARDAGMLHLLLTGGEPLLYPEFKKLYTWLGTSGIVVALNTNGTMITEEIADLLAEYPPRKVNISLYGASNETYLELCNHPKGFDAVMSGIRLLQERGILVKLNSTVTPLNEKDLVKMHQIADELGVPLQVVTYMYPPIRKEGKDIEKYIRFSPECAAEIMVADAKISTKTEENYCEWLDRMLIPYFEHQQKPIVWKECGITCYAAKNNFWVNWRGEMLPCGMMKEPIGNVLTEGFTQTWEKTVAAGSCIQNSPKCCTCPKHPICNFCSSAALAETGDFAGTPEYLCKMTDRLLELLIEERKRIYENQ